MSSVKGLATTVLWYVMVLYREGVDERSKWNVPVKAVDFSFVIACLILQVGTKNLFELMALLYHHI